MSGLEIIGGSADDLGIESFSDLDLLDLSGQKAGQRAHEAAELQAASAAEGLAETKRQFDVTRGDLLPSIEAGNLALQQQQALLGLSGQEAQQQAFSGLEDSPGQQFLKRRQERALVRNASAIGGLGGGNVKTALQEQATGFAQQDIQNQFGRLGQVAGQGQASGFQSGQFGAQSLDAQSRLRQAASEARASGVLGAQQARAQGQETAAGLGIAALSFFSDSRLKSNIKKVGEDNHGGIYSFRYIGSSKEFVGRIAQDLVKARPDAVMYHESGYLQVSEEFKPEVIKWH